MNIKLLQDALLRPEVTNQIIDSLASDENNCGFVFTIGKDNTTRVGPVYFSEISLEDRMKKENPEAYAKYVDNIFGPKRSPSEWGSDLYEMAIKVNLALADMRRNAFIERFGDKPLLEGRLIVDMRTDITLPLKIPGGIMNPSNSSKIKGYVATIANFPCLSQFVNSYSWAHWLMIENENFKQPYRTVTLDSSLNMDLEEDICLSALSPGLPFDELLRDIFEACMFYHVLGEKTWAYDVYENSWEHKRGLLNIRDRTCSFD